MPQAMRRSLAALAIFAVFAQWLLPLCMKISRPLLEAVGPNINWLVYALPALATAALALYVLPELRLSQALFVLAAAGLDSVVGEVAARSGSILYLDVLFSVLVGVVLGPSAGALSASLSCLTWAFWFPPALPFACVNILAAGLAGLLRNAGGFASLLTSAVSGLITGVVCSVTALPIRFTFADNLVNRHNFDIYSALASARPLFPDNLLTLQDYFADPVDKLVAFLFAFFLYPPVTRLLTPRSTTSDEQSTI